MIYLSCQELTNDPKRIVSYLSSLLGDNDICHFRSRNIAKHMGMTPHQLGTYISMLYESGPIDTGNGEILEIRKYGYTNSTTWELAKIKIADIQKK